MDGSSLERELRGMWRAVVTLFVGMALLIVLLSGLVVFLLVK